MEQGPDGRFVLCFPGAGNGLLDGVAFADAAQATRALRLLQLHTALHSGAKGEADLLMAELEVGFWAVSCKTRRLQPTLPAVNPSTAHRPPRRLPA